MERPLGQQALCGSQPQDPSALAVKISDFHLFSLTGLAHMKGLKLFANQEQCLWNLELSVPHSMGLIFKIRPNPGLVFGLPRGQLICHFNPTCQPRIHGPQIFKPVKLRDAHCVLQSIRSITSSCTCSCNQSIGLEIHQGNSAHHLVTKYTWLCAQADVENIS